MTLPALPQTGEQDFDTKARTVFDSWKASIEAKAESNHTHGEAGIIISIVANEAALGAGTLDGESKVTADTGHRWVWNATEETWADMDNSSLQPPSGTSLTGNIIGLEYSYYSDDTITVSGGTCYDRFNTTVLTLAVAGNFTIPNPAINTTYNIFVTDAGDIQFDSDVDGTTLLAGSVNQLRWIGFVLTDASGNIVQFTARGDMYDYNVVVGSATGAVAMGFSLAPFLPVSRCLACTVSMNISSYRGKILDGTTHAALENYDRETTDGGISATVVPDNNGEIWAYATVSKGVVVTSVLLQR